MVQTRIEDCYDNSSVSAFQQCPMSYYIQYVKGLRKTTLDDSTAKMNFGSFAHKFWEAHFGNSDATFPSLVEGYEEPESLPQYSKKALKFFCETYYDKYNETDKAFDVKEVELSSHFKIGPYEFIVKRDGVVSINSNIFGLEHKTTGDIKYNFFNKFFMASQISAQCYDIKEKYGQCSGVLLNVGCIKSLKRKPTGDYDGVLNNGDGTFLACKFNRDYINRTVEELKDWKQNTIGWINEIEQCKKHGRWLKSTGLWGGIICSGCEYRELCKMSHGTELDESIMDCLYETKDAYEYLKEGDK